MSAVKFDDSRIKDNPDTKLLERIRTYYAAFTTGDFETIRSLEAEEYTMTDIPLAVVKAPREVWYNINRGFTEALYDLHVIAISLEGSSEPGCFANLEHVVWFKLKQDPPPEVQPNLPPGAKAGDTVGMINLGVLWWDADGKIIKELVYGRLTWDKFDIAPFDGK